MAAVPPLRVQRAAELPPGVRDLAGGNPDERLLPSLADALGRLDASHKLYGGEAKLPELASFARAEPEASRALNARPPARWVRLVWAPLPPLPPPRRPGPSRPAAGPAEGRTPAKAAKGRL